MARADYFVVPLIAGLFAGIFTGDLQQASAQAESAGKPIVASALVTQPAPLAGVESWTIESILPRGALQGLAVHPKLPLFVTGGSDSVIRIWNSRTFVLERALIGHSGYVSVAAWSRDGTYLATGAYDDEVVIWDGASGKIVRRFKAHTGGVYSLAWSADSRWIAAAGDGSETLHIWEASAGTLIKHLAGHPQSILALAVSPDGR